MVVRFFIAIFCAFAISGCGIYSFTGGQFSGAKTFSVDYFKPQSAMVTPLYAQRFTESLKDLLLAQSLLRLAERNGELNFTGSVVDYRTAPVAVQSGAAETASLNRLTITIKVKYENTLDPELNFEKTFSKFADYDANQDLFTIEESLWSLINEQLTQEIYNASVGNW
ncbi:MAG: LPS assembly lipoprotein LptE [Flavobacteriales bacterium]